MTVDPYALLTMAEAAKYLHVSESQLRAMVADGRVPVKPIVVSERRRLIPMWGLLGWASRESGCPLPVPPAPRPGVKAGPEY